jgi:hypothetical protein
MTDTHSTSLCACGCGQIANKTFLHGHNSRMNKRPLLPLALCECGCGEFTKRVTNTCTKTGVFQGHPNRFLSRHNRNRVVPKSYRMRGTRLEHVVIAEEALGRTLRGSEEVHHADGNFANNSRDNLIICPSRGYHMLLHARMRVLAAGGDPNTQKLCSRCHRVLDFDAFNRLTANASTQRHAYCKVCNKADKQERKLRCQ